MNVIEALFTSLKLKVQKEYMLITPNGDLKSLNIK